MINIVDFYADWCGPCQRLKPILEQIRNEMKDVTLEYVNIDNEMTRAQINNVSSLPTIVFEKNGKEFARLNGTFPKSKIIEIITSNQ